MDTLKVAAAESLRMAGQMDNIDVVTNVTYLFFVYLILAIIVERVVEILVAIFNYFEMRGKWYGFWNRRAVAYQKKFERLYGYQDESADRVKKLFSWLLWKVIAEKPHEGGKEVISANLIRLNYLRVATRVAAFAISCILVAVVDLDFIEIIKRMIPKFKLLEMITGWPFFRFIVTAALISIGSEPLHQVIRRVEKYAATKAATSTGGAQ